MPNLHFNNGEPVGSPHANRPHQDGVLVCYDRRGVHIQRFRNPVLQVQDSTPLAP